MPPLSLLDADAERSILAVPSSARSPAAVVAPSRADYDKFTAMQTLNSRLIFLRDRDSVYEEVMAAAQRVLGYDICAVLMHAPQRNSLRVEACRGYDRRLMTVEIPLDREIGLCRAAFVGEQPVYAPDVLNDPRYYMADPALRSELVIPIRTRRGTIGVFDFGSRALGAFAEDDIRLCCILVDQMAIGLENIRLFDELTQTRDSIIMGMARLAESRDGQMSGHLERICEYARLLAGRLTCESRFAAFLDDEYVETIARSAALHDIGKVGIPDSILLKPGKLTAAEFEVMKTHTTLGGTTLSELATQHGSFFMLRMGRDIAFAHHERWDGNGYPSGLRGDTIPLSARIVALCDVYDALTSQRIYKTAISHARAAGLIRAEAGRHFDPQLVGLFDELCADFEAVHRKFRG